MTPLLTIATNVENFLKINFEKELRKQTPVDNKDQIFTYTTKEYEFKVFENPLNNNQPVMVAYLTKPPMNVLYASVPLSTNNQRTQDLLSKIFCEK
jgi:hypothetical protein